MRAKPKNLKKGIQNSIESSIPQKDQTFFIKKLILIFTFSNFKATKIINIKLYFGKF